MITRLRADVLKAIRPIYARAPGPSSAKKNRQRNIFVCIRVCGQRIMPDTIWRKISAMKMLTNNRFIDLFLRVFEVVTFFFIFMKKEERLL